MKREEHPKLLSSPLMSYLFFLIAVITFQTVT